MNILIAVSILSLTLVLVFWFLIREADSEAGLDDQAKPFVGREPDAAATQWRDPS